MPNRRPRPVPGVLSAAREGGRAVLLMQVAGQAMIRSCATRRTLVSGPTSGPETSQPPAARPAIRPAAGTAAAQPAEPTTMPARRGGSAEARPEELAGPAGLAARAAQVAPPERAGWVDRAGPSPQAGLVGSSTTTKAWWGIAIADAAHRTPTAPVGARTLAAVTLLATIVTTRAAPTSPAWAGRSGRALHNTTAKGRLSTATVDAGSRTRIAEAEGALTRSATTPRACTATP